ncbi:type IV pilin protein [Ectopseudomonas oleovorans]|uniref:Type IV pilin protein n=2 Tax=Ectopseudomonas oleovorans TaxID=301 RepID=A0A427HTE4_ECTOL|nr:type IV pilin protein [Pseudomonas oleovorans]
MITVVVIGILASIAYPSYQEFVKRGNRTEGQAFLNEVAARQERYFVQNNEYITSDDDIDKLNLKDGSTSETGKYELSIGKEDDDGGYTLTATPNFDDTKCGNLILNAIGNRGAAGKLDSGSASDKEKVRECWR